MRRTAGPASRSRRPRADAVAAMPVRSRGGSSPPPRAPGRRRRRRARGRGSGYTNSSRSPRFRRRQRDRTTRSAIALIARRAMAKSMYGSSAEGSARASRLATDAGSCALQDALDRQLELLAGEAQRDRPDRHDRVGDVPRRQRVAQPCGDRRPASSSSHTSPSASSTKRISSPGPPSASSRWTTRLLLHRVQLLDDPIELARPEADSAAVQRGVRAPGDDAAAVVEELHPVALAPDAREVLEVGRPIARSVGVVPEPDRHRRHRLGDDELAELADDGVAVRVVGGGRDAEAASGDGAGPHGQQRVALDDAGADVGATAPVDQQRCRRRAARRSTRPRREAAARRPCTPRAAVARRSARGSTPALRQALR